MMSNSDDLKEKLSALVDNELDELNERQLMTTLDKDLPLRQTWERYHLVRSVLRGETGAELSTNSAERVASRLDSEPVPVAPFQRQRFARTAGMLAIAASVAAIAVVSVQWSNRSVSSPVTTLAVAKPVPDKIIRAGTTRWNMKQKAPEAESALNAFLVEHNEFASSAGFGGMMPYVRVVGYDNTNTEK